MSFTDDFSKISPHLLVKSLMSKVCPSCGSGKAARQTVCRPCYGQLQKSTGVALYQLVGRGYEKAFAQAMRELMVTTVHFSGSVRIGPSAYVTADESLHVDIEEMLRILNTADTPENRDAAVGVVQEMVKRLYPETKVSVV